MKNKVAGSVLWRGVIFFVLSVLLIVNGLAAREYSRVLVISSYHPAFPTIFYQVEGVKSVFKGTSVQIDFEFLDSKRYNSPQKEIGFRDLLMSKFANNGNYKLIMTADENALLFALKYQHTFFQDKPIIFFGINNVRLARSLNANPSVTGVIEAVSMRETLAIIQKLRSQKFVLNVLIDDTASCRGDWEIFQKIAKTLPELTYQPISLKEYSFESFFDRLRQVPRHDAVLLLSAYQDKNGESMNFEDSLRLISENLSAPVFHLWFHGLGYGVTGGRVISHVVQGQIAAKIALRVINGNPISEIPVVLESPNHDIFDYNELKKHHISLKDLPAEAEILNMPPKLSVKYRNQIMVFAIVSAILAILAISMGIVLYIRARSDKEVKKIQARLMAHIKNTPLAIIEWDLETKITSWNRSAAEIFGYRAEDVKGESVASILFQTHSEDSQKAFWRSLEDGTNSAFHECVNKKSNRDIIFCEWYYTALRDESGQVVGGAAAILDVSDRVQSNRKLEESEEKFRSITNHIKDLIALVDKNGVITYASPASQSLFLKDSNQLMGQPLMSFVQEEWTRKIKTALVYQRNILDYECRMQRANSGIFWGELTLIHRAEDSLVTIKDISDRKEAEEKSKVSEQNYLDLFMNSIQPIGIARDERLIKINPKMSELLGRKEDDIVNQTFHDFIHPDDRQMVISRHKARLRGRDEPSIYQFRLLHSDGNTIWVEINTVLIRWEGQEATLNYYTNITDQKYAENQIRENLKEKETLLHEIHHRVKNNMQIIASLLRLQMSSCDITDPKEMLRENMGRVYAMATIHESLYQSESLSEVNIKQYLESLTQTLHQTYSLEQKKVSFQFDIEDLNVKIDVANPLGLVLNEMISNSLKYAFPGDRVGVIRISSRRLATNEAVLEYQDNGVGLPDDFDWETTDTLGVRLIKSIIERQLDGAIHLDKQGGLKFTMKFSLLSAYVDDEQGVDESISQRT